MKSLATAIVDALAFLELSDDEIVDEDSAVSVMESISAVLAKANSKERAALATAAKSALAREKSDSKDPDAIEFYETFMESLGLT